MKIVSKFEQIIGERTSDGFHDGVLKLLTIQTDLQELTVVIEHMVNKGTTDEEAIMQSTFVFRGIGNLILNNDVECFPKEDDISSFDIEDSGKGPVVRLIGIKGWWLTFSTVGFEYSESRTGIWKPEHHQSIT